MKDILVLTNYFYPENFKVNELVFRLAKKGHAITVVTAIPNYPNREIFKSNYSFCKKRKEIVNGVTIIRLPLLYRGKGSSFRLILNYSSFLFISCIYSIYLALFKRFDILFVHHVSPIFIAIPAIVIKKIRKKKIIFWNLDLWPEALLGTANIKNTKTMSLLNGLIFWINKQVDYMLVSSRGFINPLVKRGTNLRAITYFPNWVDDNTSTKDSGYLFPYGFNIVFAGNLGKAQDPASIFRLIEELKEYEFNWIFIGGGRSLSGLKKDLNSLDMKSKVYFPGIFPLNQMPSLYKQADLLLISLNQETSYTLPGRVQAYMNSGKPIMGMVNGETLDLINKIKCGVCYKSGDYINLSKAIIKFTHKSKVELEAIGKRGLQYSIDNFTIDNNLNILNNIFLKYESSSNR